MKSRIFDNTSGRVCRLNVMCWLMCSLKGSGGCIQGMLSRIIYVILSEGVPICRMGTFDGVGNAARPLIIIAYIQNIMQDCKFTECKKIDV